MKKLLIVTDYKIIKCKEKFYTNIKWDKNFFNLFNGEIDKIILIGHLYQDCMKLDNLIEVDTKYYEIYDVNFFNFSKIYYNFKTLIKLIKNTNVVLIKLFYINSIITFFINKYFFKKPIVSQIVGDSAKSFLLREDIIKNDTIRKVLSKFIRKLIIFIQSNVDCAVYVAEFLFDKYPTSGRYVISNESWIKKDFIYKRKIERIKNLLFVGRIVKEKGIFELLEAFCQLCKKNKDLTLTIVGDGKDFNKAVELINNCECKDRIILTGWIRALSLKLFKIYRSNDLFILPSYAEGMPLVLLEAMANGCIVLASNLDGVKELITDDKNGFIMNDICSDKIAFLIEKITNLNKSFLEEIQINAYKTVEKNLFEIERQKIANEIIKLVNY